MDRQSIYPSILVVLLVSALMVCCGALTAAGQSRNAYGQSGGPPGTSAVTRIIYVDSRSTGVNDGSSWADAYNYLQDALADANTAQKPIEIRAAQGIYKPDQGTNQAPGDRAATFQLINGVAIKGSYAGFGEPDPDARDITLYQTIMSGDLEGNDKPDFLTAKDNSSYVVTGSHTDQNAVLDGFTITGENRFLPPSNDDLGAAAMLIESGHPTVVGCTFRGSDCGIRNIASSPVLTCCVFRDNPGCGVANSDGSSPVIADCLFKDNSCGMGSDGGSNLVITNCTFESNDGGVGGRGSGATLTSCTFKSNRDCGVGVHDCQLTLTNCTFEQNGDGWTTHGAINSDKSDLTLSDCAFIRNNGRGIYNSRGSSLTLARCVFLGNVGYATIGSHGDANATLYDCTFRANSTGDGGGAIYATGNLVLRNCRFSGNSAQFGPGAVDAYGNLTALGCVFSGNSGGSLGGAIRAGRAVLSNCTFTANRDLGGDKANAIEPTGSSPSSMKLTHCIIWNGEESIRIRPATEPAVTVTYSNIQGGWLGEGNTDVDPCFADHGYWADANDPNVMVEPDDPNAVWIDGDYHLISQAGRWDPQTENWVKDDVTSPCIDAGHVNSPIGFEPFPNGGRINMGAYGGTAEASKSYFGEPVCETIVAGDINGDCKVDYADFITLALHWLQRGTDFVNKPPTVTIIEPANAAVFYYPTPITIRADASDVDGSVLQVQLIRQYRSNGGSVTTSITDTDGADGWQTVWYWWRDRLVAEANWTITAQATDDDGAVAVSPPVVITAYIPVLDPGP